MAAAIKPIEARSVHQIQSGQVIVDLCSVVKELVENALDADANSIEVRFKNNGLEAIEVQDNGTGIAEANYENLTLKHYTSKLSTYEDLSTVQTFGFRGEALSSLCALSDFSVVTAQAHEAPKGKRLDFETSGKLKSTSLTAAQKGTTITVENLFAKLPVRQKELSKNIKREYGKVIGLLHAYACISTQVKFTVKSAMPKGRSAVVFSTKGNSTTRDNIANVYGAKMLSQLIALDLNLDFSGSSLARTGNAEVVVSGHISRPVFGEGRQTPDRQMFFVNGRPCGLPQIAKAINEVYKSYNVSQSPFIFADFKMDTNAYDVNVSPDKRTILLHDSVTLTDSLKTALTDLFDDSEQTVPQSYLQLPKPPPFRQLTVSRTSTDDDLVIPTPPSAHGINEGSVNENLARATHVEEPEGERALDHDSEGLTALQKLNNRQPNGECITTRLRTEIADTEQQETPSRPTDEYQDDSSCTEMHAETPARDVSARMSKPQEQEQSLMDDPNGTQIISDRQLRKEQQGVMPNAFDRMRPRRLSPELATIIIGDKVTTRTVGGPSSQTSKSETYRSEKVTPITQFSQRLQKFDLQQAEGQPDAEQNLGLEPEDVTAETDDPLESDHMEEKTLPSPAHHIGSSSSPDGDMVIKDAEKPQKESQQVEEENRVAELIQFAQRSGLPDDKTQQHRTTQALKGSSSRDSTVDQVMTLDLDPSLVESQARKLKSDIQPQEKVRTSKARDMASRGNDEERLSLTISKSDFAEMHIAGQFNLGFIIAVRHKDETDTARSKDELFIIDQHASDEKYNFERLQAETIVGNQRLVHPVILDLTAVEEETVLDNETALQQNGFIIDADQSGEVPVGQRCKLLSLPLSKEVTFNLRDLEELIHLLSDSHVSNSSAYVPRPSKVRKMFAMRACRSSIMIGKTLSRRQMRNVLDHMGSIDKPWNCPHGRPTMRHLTSLDDMDERVWKEGDGVFSYDSSPGPFRASDLDIWKTYLQ